MVTSKNPFRISCADGIFAFQPMFSYGQRSKCADLLNSYHLTFVTIQCLHSYEQKSIPDQLR